MNVNEKVLTLVMNAEGKVTGEVDAGAESLAFRKRLSRAAARRMSSNRVRGLSKRV
jgi:hypothetical protein